MKYTLLKNLDCIITFNENDEIFEKSDILICDEKNCIYR
jgi:hypothetical protein